jgi:hypothetical protein
MGFHINMYNADAPAGETLPMGKITLTMEGQDPQTLSLGTLPLTGEPRVWVVSRP